ncbi:cytochrome c assembly protein [Dehalogenimonas lykanthroporepellens BL-DC-9]|jgi:heme exporter protein C|nr:cytochrome c assembly protein [Dehalogenimonas lykanthroporepellens BL-DC-9]
MRILGSKVSYGLLGLTAVAVLVSLVMIFIVVPTEATMGIIQRIFYYHVPVAWVAFLAFFVVLIASILYLWKRKRKWDVIASASAELGVIFTSLVLITGSIWAKPIWGVWWTWDARLTTSLVLWLIYVAYLMVRASIGEEEKAARFAAVVGIIGFVDVPIVALAIQLWGTQHPGAVIFEGGLAPVMLATLLISLLAVTSLYALLLVQRVSLRNDELRLDDIKRRIEMIREEGNG